MEVDAPAQHVDALRALVQTLKAEKEDTARIADQRNEELIKTIANLDDRHENVTKELDSTRKDLQESQRRMEEIRQENIRLQQRQEEADAAAVTMRREQASLQHSLDSKEGRLTAALAEAEALVAQNRKLIKDEAEARSGAERARYEAASAAAERDHAQQDRKLLEERLEVVQRRAKDADMLQDQTLKQLRDANAALSSDCDKKTAEAARLHALNVRLQGENEKFSEEGTELKQKLREKEGELSAIIDACDSEKSAYDSSLAAANARFEAAEEQNATLKASVRELSLLVEQQKQNDNQQVQLLTAERDEAREAAQKAEEHASALASARGLSEPPRGSGALVPAAQREPLQPIDAQAGDAQRGVVITAPSGQASYTSLLHELETTKRKVREQAHELQQMSREYDEAMAILKARAVDLDVQSKHFNNMRAQNKALNISLAALADDKAAAEASVARARASADSAARRAMLCAQAANDRAATIAQLLAEISRLKGLQEPKREALPYPNVAEMGGGVDGWDAEAQALVSSEKDIGTATSVDAVVAMNIRLSAALRAILLDAKARREERALQKESELKPQLEAQRKRADTLTATMKEKEALIEQKERQVQSLLAALSAQPAAGEDGSAGQNVAIERMKEKMAEDRTKLQEMHVSQRKVVEEQLADAQKQLLEARTESNTKVAEAQFANDRASSAAQEARRLQEDLAAARSALTTTQEKLLDAHKAITDSSSEQEKLRSRAAAAEGDVEGARKAAAAAEAAATDAEERCSQALVKAALADGEKLALEKMHKALQESFDSQSERLDKVMAARDMEAGGLRAEVAQLQEELQQARLSLADTSTKDKADRLEAEASDLRDTLQQKDAQLTKVQAEAAAVSAVRGDLEQQIATLRQQLSDAQAGAVAPSASGAPAAAKDSGADTAAVDASVLSAQLRSLQLQLAHVRHEKDAAQKLAEQHKSSAEALERHRDALQNSLVQLRASKLEAEKKADEDVATAQAHISELDAEIAKQRELTSAAESARLDAQRHAEASEAEARQWKSECDRLGDKMRRQAQRAANEAKEASSREAVAAAKHDQLTLQSAEYVQRIQKVQSDLKAAEEELKVTRADAQAAADASRREAAAKVAEIEKLKSELSDARAPSVAGAGPSRAVEQGADAPDGGQEGAAEPDAYQQHSAEELRKLLSQCETQLRAALGEANAQRAAVRRLSTQLQALKAQKAELCKARDELQHQVAAPVLSESALRQSIESSKQYESLRASNDRLLDEKARLERELGMARNAKASVEVTLRASNADLTKATRQLDAAKKDLEESRKQCEAWQKEAHDCVARYGTDDQKQIQSLKEKIRSLETSLQTSHSELASEKKSAESLKRDKARLEREKAAAEKGGQPARKPPTRVEFLGTSTATPVSGTASTGTRVEAQAGGARAAKPIASKEAEMKVAALEAEVKHHKQQLAQSHSELATCKQQLAQVQEELSSAKEAMTKEARKKMQEEVKRLTKALESLGWVARVPATSHEDTGQPVKKAKRIQLDLFVGKTNARLEHEAAMVEKANDLTQKLEALQSEHAREVTKHSERESELLREITQLKLKISNLVKQKENLEKRVSELQAAQAAAAQAQEQPHASPTAPVTAVPSVTAQATPPRSKRQRDELPVSAVAPADVSAAGGGSGASAAATPASPAAQATPKKPKITKPVLEPVANPDQEEAAGGEQKADEEPLSKPSEQPAVEAAGEEEKEGDADMADAEEEGAEGDDVEEDGEIDGEGDGDATGDDEAELEEEAGELEEDEEDAMEGAQEGAVGDQGDLETQVDEGDQEEEEGEEEEMEHEGEQENAGATTGAGSSEGAALEDTVTAPEDQAQAGDGATDDPGPDGALSADAAGQGEEQTLAGPTDETRGVEDAHGSRAPETPDAPGATQKKSETKATTAKKTPSKRSGTKSAKTGDSAAGVEKKPSTRGQSAKGEKKDSKPPRKIVFHDPKQQQ